MIEPETLVEAIRHFADPDVAFATMVDLRWPGGVCCPTCGRKDVRFVKTRRIWECKGDHPKLQFSAKVGTIFENSPIGLDKWFIAIWIVADCKNGISSYELHRAVDVTQKSAWFMLHRIRLAMQAGSLLRAEDDVEADETYVGGLVRSMYKNRIEKTIKGIDGGGKTIVKGILERGGTKQQANNRVRTRVVKNPRKAVLHEEIRSAGAPGSRFYTDAAGGYQSIGDDYQHEVVEYVRGHAHPNGLENFWSLLKRSLKGICISVESFHLSFRCLDEQVFRFKVRKDNDYSRFSAVLS